MDSPRLVVLDVNETLSDLAPLRGRFDELGLGEGVAATWFAGVLRDGFALAVLGTSAPFADLGRDVLRDLAPDLPDGDVESVIDAFTTLGVHPDVGPGLRALAETDVEVVTLTNGSVAITEQLLETAGLRDLVARTLSVEAAGVWKPHPSAYAHALSTCDVAASEALMVAVHPWDLHGAAHAGLRTAWIRRGERTWPRAFTGPDVTVAGLDELARVLGGTSADAAGER